MASFFEALSLNYRPKRKWESWSPKTLDGKWSLKSHPNFILSNVIKFSLLHFHLTFQFWKKSYSLSFFTPAFRVWCFSNDTSIQVPSNFYVNFSNYYVSEKYDITEHLFLINKRHFWLCHYHLIRNSNECRRQTVNKVRHKITFILNIIKARLHISFMHAFSALLCIL